MNRGRRVELSPAFVLHHRPWRDTSRILEVLTRDHGQTWQRISPDLSRNLDWKALPIMGKVWPLEYQNGLALHESTTALSNVVALDGKILPQVDPFGPVGPWREVGKQWGACDGMTKLQEWYPDPPRVLLISNNEHARLAWTDASRRARLVRPFPECKRRTVPKCHSLTGTLGQCRSFAPAIAPLRCRRRRVAHRAPGLSSSPASSSRASRRRCRHRRE